VFHCAPGAEGQVDFFRDEPTLEAEASTRQQAFVDGSSARHLRLSGMVEALPGRVAQAEAAPLPHLEFLELLVEDELACRADRLFARRLKQAGITVMKTLADFDWRFNPKMPKPKIVELASARFVDTHSGALRAPRTRPPRLGNRCAIPTSAHSHNSVLNEGRKSGSVSLRLSGRD